MHPLTLRARDGLRLVSYLTLPAEADATVEPGHPSVRTPLPLVLLVHGGPWDRDGHGFDAQHQWLANRGYAVLAVNFRGSTGFGKRFMDAGDLEWGARMDDDLSDAVAWACAQGIADPARVAIMGGSYGGYAVLAAMTRHPDKYVCGVDIVGPSNLETLLASIPPYWEADRRRLYKAVGNPETEDGRALLRARSPLHRAGDLRRPLLIAQGANDPRVLQAEADQMVAALRANRIPVSYLLFPDEGHGFQRPANDMAFKTEVEAFLASHLGGRAQPPDAQETAGHTMQRP